MNQQSPFKWRHFEAEIIRMSRQVVLALCLSYHDVEEMMLE